MISVNTIAFMLLIFLHLFAENANSKVTTPRTPLEQALALKLKGNKYFKARCFDQAIASYEEGLQKCPLEAVHVSRLMK